MKKLYLALMCFLSFSAVATVFPIHKMELSNSTPVFPVGAIWWYGDHDPGTTETSDAGVISQYDNYVNINTGKTWMNIDATLGSMAWQRLGNAAAANPTSVSLSFGASRMPNTTYDTLVTASIAQTSTLLTAADVLFQVDYGSGFVTIGEFKLGGLAASMTTTSTFAVPMGASYQLVNSSGTNSIAYLYEITE